jgi:hypothetical protein
VATSGQRAIGAGGRKTSSDHGGRLTLRGQRNISRSRSFGWSNRLGPAKALTPEQYLALTFAPHVEFQLQWRSRRDGPVGGNDGLGSESERHRRSRRRPRHT